MKAVHDDDLAPLHKHTQAIAKKIAEEFSEKIINTIINSFQKDIKCHDLTYSGVMTFINTIGQNIFLQIFGYSCHIGRQFSQVEHCSRELFEEVIGGIRILADYHEINKKEYPGGIKKIEIKE